MKMFLAVSTIYFFFRFIYKIYKICTTLLDHPIQQALDMVLMAYLSMWGIILIFMN